MQIIFPPSPIVIPENQQSVFLAGSIEMGSAAEWQDEFAGMLADKNITILNPRRKAWDSTWKQSIENPVFAEQVHWELEGLEKASIIVMYFSPETKSPVTMLEFGLFANSGKLIVCCPEGFWRKGNIDMVCQRYGIPQVSDLKQLAEAVKKLL
jgi:hypothetical protein